MRLNIYTRCIYFVNKKFLFKQTVSDKIIHRVKLLVKQVLLLLFTVKSFGQSNLDANHAIKFETLTMEQGLSSNQISDILKDKDGFLWVSTKNGLNKYDGYQFENFLYEIDDSTSLSHSNITDMMVENNGRLWLATWGGGVSIFNFEKQTFSKSNNAFNTALIDIHNHIKSTHQSKDGSFWLGTLYGLVHFDPNTGNLDSYFSQDNNVNSISDNWTTEILERNDGTMLFVGNDGRLNVFDAKEKHFQRYEIRQKTRKKELVQITHLFEDASQNLLIGTDNGLYLFEQKKGVFTNLIVDEATRVVLVGSPINDIMAHDESRLWLGTSRGLVVVNPVNTGDTPISFSGSRNILPQHVITKIHQDFQGNIWIGTANKGLKVIYNKKKQFSSIDLGRVFAQAITFDKENNLWVGTNGVLYQFDTHRKLKKKYTLDSGMSSASIHSLLADDNRLLIGTAAGLNVLDMKTGAITLWRDENNILNTTIATIEKDHEGNYWLGSVHKGLISIDGISGEVSNYTAISDDSRIGNYNATSLCFDSKNKLWVGLYGGGINLFDIQKREFIKRYLNDPKDPFSLIDNNVLDIYKAKNGGIWIATVDGGLNHFNPKTDRFKSYLKRDGLPSNNVLSIIEDTSENIWFGTHKGLAKLDKESDKIKFFDTSDGLIDNLFRPRAAGVDANGRLYFGASGGVIHFNDNQINTNTEEPDLVLTKFKIDNKDIDYNKADSPLQKHISFTQSLELEHNQTAIAIEYVALNYISSAKNKYAYKLDGLENEWRDVGSQRVAHYSNIPAGTYAFMVKASNNDGIWTSEPLTLDIKVLPHPLQSRLAYSIYLLLFLFLNAFIIWLVKVFTRKKQQVEVAQIERDTEKDLTQFKLQFFTNISHELRTHLTLIVYPIKKILKNQNRADDDQTLLDRVDLNLTRLVKLTDEIIDFRKVEQGKTSLTLQKSNIVEFLQEITNLFIHIAKEHEMKFEFETDQPELIWCFDQEKLKKIVFNLLTNAFKYTPNGGSVKLSVEQLNPKNGSEEKLRISIADNGIGIKQEDQPYIFDRFYNSGKEQLQNNLQSSSGIGLALVKRLVELQKGTIYVDSVLGKGSNFYLELEKQECADVQTIPTSPTSPNYSSVVHEKWEDILNLERRNVQEELMITNELKPEEVPVVLVVDDNKEICMILNDILSHHYKVLIASNGKQALKIADKKNIDLVVSDIMMPVMDGIELCNKLKSDIKTSHIPVVLLTAKSGIENELHGLRIGADAYLTKPFNNEKFSLTVGNIISNRKKIQLSFKGEKAEEQSQPEMNPLDKKLIDRIFKVINKNLSDVNLSVDLLGKEAGLSRMHLFRKLKALTGESPSELVKRIRLEKSKVLIEKGTLSITEISYDTGFSTPGNFSTAFKKFYGDTPAQYRSKYFKSSSK